MADASPGGGGGLLAAQRARFLAYVAGARGPGARVRLRGAGGARGVEAAGRLLALDSALSEALVAGLATPLGTLPAARVRLDVRDVLWLELPPPNPGAEDPLIRPLADFMPPPRVPAE